MPMNILFLYGTISITVTNEKDVIIDLRGGGGGGRKGGAGGLQTPFLTVKNIVLFGQNWLIVQAL